MTETLMHVDAVSKKFCRTLKRSLWYGVKDMGRELSGATGDRTRLRKDEFWALKDVSFVLRRGETLGVIGHNGAGKTSLLRLLNGLIKPDEGRIEVRGRMQALIALGAGFDPVLTGRENIYINAAVLGMSKAEVNRRFDEIVDFSGIPDFIDTPLQSYSSGMRVRLGFAVAAHMSPDILLVDEVLAVGDLAFRAKCLGRIEELISSGVAVILVSHSLYTISNVCRRALVMEQGRLLYDGETAGAVDRYRASLASRIPAGESETGTGEIVITAVEVLDESDHPAPDFGCGNQVKIRLSYHARRPVLNPVPNIVLRTLGGEQVIGLRTDLDGVYLGELSGHGTIDLLLPEFNLLPGIYILTVTLLHSGGIASYDRKKEVATISVRGGNTTNGLIYLEHSWQQRVEADQQNQPLLEVGT